MAEDAHSSGGFLLSPAPSSTVASTGYLNLTLPHPRTHPLRSGGSKESAFIRHVDQQLLTVQRRFAKRVSAPASQSLGLFPYDSSKLVDAPWPGDPARGYNSMKEACGDIEELVNVIWVSGTPSLQIPYLINMALLLCQIIPAMPVKAKSLFRVLHKMDHCFASLIQGKDVNTGETLPGFESGKGVTKTEKVRIRSLVERTRVTAIEAFKRGEFEYEGSNETTTDEDGHEMGVEGELVLEGDDLEDVEEEEDSWDMQLARVYDRTVVELGDSLEQPSIGILTEPRSRQPVERTQ